jgi:hypothetical protein
MGKSPLPVPGKGLFSRQFELNSAQEELHVLHAGLQFFAASRSSSGIWHFLYFLPLPHQQSSFLPGFTKGAAVPVFLNAPSIRSNKPIFPPRRFVDSILLSMVAKCCILA